MLQMMTIDILKIEKTPGQVCKKILIGGTATKTNYAAYRYQYKFAKNQKALKRTRIQTQN